MRFAALSILLAFTVVTLLPADAEARRRGGSGSKSYASSSYSTSKASTRTTKRSTSSAWYVKTATLNVRDDSNESGGVVRKLKKGDRISAHETEGNWIRISDDDTYPAEWVSSSSLSRKKP